MAAIKDIIAAFIAAFNSLLAILGMEDKQITVDPEVESTVDGWVDTLIKG